MKKYILYILSIVISLSVYSQSRPDIFLGLNVNDSTSALSERQEQFKKNEAKDVQPRTPLSVGDIQTWIPTIHSVNTSRDVEEIPYQISTTPHGFLSINVPIKIYPSPKGLSPTISLAYNSLNGNGILGMGWSLSGLSNITRSHKVFYYDNKAESTVIQDKNSVFILDGMRLIKIGENSSEINYLSEQGNIKVTGYLSGDKIVNFKVFYSDGRNAVFGFLDSTLGEDISYPITRMNDNTGNSIHYEYEKINGHYRIKKILYGLEKEIAIEFNYTSSHSDNIISYYAGKQMEYNYYLHSITTQYNNQILRTYSLVYTTKRFTPVIDKIECSANGSNLNPLILYYGDNNQIEEFKSDSVFTGISWKYDNPALIRATKGKFDYGTYNDGIITFPNRIHYVHHYRKKTIGGHSNNQIRNQYNNFTDNIHVNVSLGSSYGDYVSLETGEGFVDVFPVDLDGDLEEEIVKINNTCENSSQENLKFEVYSRGILGTPLRLKYTRNYSFTTALRDNNKVYSLHPKYYFSGDFTGEGKNYILAAATHNPMGMNVEGKFYIFDIENDTIIQIGSSFEYNVVFPGSGDSSCSSEQAYNDSDKLYTFDFNGDRKMDVCLINNKGTHIYTLEKSASGYEFVLLATYTDMKRSDLKDKTVMLGDFNADGNPDFLISPLKNSGNIWNILYSTGGNAPAFVKNDIALATVKDEVRFLVHDMDSDRYTDFIEVSGKGKESKLTTYFLVNSKLKKQHSFPIEENTILIPTDIQSRNYYNSILSHKGLWTKKIFYSHDNSRSTKLTGLINSFGIISKFSYNRLSEDWNYQMDYKKPDSLYTLYKGEWSVLKAVQSYQNNDKIQDDYYIYQNAILHKQGLGFRGFEQITRIDNIKDMTFVQQFDPYNFSVLKSEDSPFGKATYEYIFDVKDNKIAKILLNNKEETDKLKGITVKSSYMYDNYGNPIEEKIDYGSGITSTTSTKLSNIDTNAIYLLGRLDEQSVKNTRGGSSVISKTAISYNDKHLPISKINYYNNNKTSEESYVYYDNMDLKESKSRTYSSNNWLTTKYEYDTQGRIKRETDPYGLYVDYTYNDKGQLESKKNYLGHITSYTYDNWGRNIQTNYPDGAIETNTLEWATLPTEALYVAKSAMTGQPDAETYYDALGREIRKGAKRFDGTYLYTDYKYDFKGHLKKISLPFKGNTPNLWHTYAYDGYDRITSLSYASGKKDTYSYKGLQTISVIDSISVTKTEDVTGKIIKIKDDAGIIAYNYRPDGQLTSIIAPGNIETSFVYDQYGRQTMLKDPSAGDKSYEYDAAGNITKETDADGKTIQMQYDEYNRLISKEIADGFGASYVYDSNGMLVSISGTNGTSKTYEYDNLLRLKKEKETIVDNNYLEKSYTYSGNMLSSVSYASQSGNIATENYYYNNGHHTETKLNGNTSVWKLTEENSLGMPTASVTGVLSRTYSYDAYGMPTGRSIKKGNTTIQNFNYSFDPLTGNLDWRKDNIRNLTENFRYDYMNRLTEFGGNTIVYNKRGNIVDHSGVGYFEYSKEKPYAIEGVSPYKEVIPMRDQHISYNALMRPDSISEGEYNATLLYDMDGNRIKMQLKRGDDNELIRYYVSGQYEIDHTLAGVEERLYLDGDAYSAAAVYVRKGSNPWQVHYIGRDYLGSITHITDAEGNLKEEYSYDPWGRLRNPQDYILYEIDQDPMLFLSRGYTGHEHLPMFGLINMNARLYDPVLGRFLSPDPYVQAPYMSQNFNRYSYALNNPLRYTDPNGEFWHIIAGAVIGGVVNLVANWDNIDGFWDGFSTFALGAGAGAATAATGGSGASVWAVAGVSASGGAIVGANNSIVAQTGANFSGFNQVNWGEVGKSSAIGGVSSAAGSYAGSWASSLNVSVNGFSHPLINVGLGSVTSSATGHVVAGTTIGLFEGENLGTAFYNSFDGIGKSMAIGTSMGIASYVGVSYANKVNPFLNKPIVRDEFEYTYTKTAEKHMTDVIKHGSNKGELARPYMKSPLTIREIMSTGLGTPDATYPGGANYRIPGTFRGSQGIWELGINPNTNVIYHFNFVH